MSIESERRSEGERFYYHVDRLLQTDDGFMLHGGKRFSIKSARVRLGLRVCMLLLDCGLDNNRLHRLLRDATLPHLIPEKWDFDHAPVSYLQDRYIVIEVAWPDGLQRDNIQLKDIAHKSERSGDKLIIGQNQRGQKIVLPSSEIEHILVGGQTGCGKSYLMRSIIEQLSRHKLPMKPVIASPNMIVMIDGKRGEGFSILDGVPGQVGPIAYEIGDVINALGWCIDEMNARYDYITNKNNGARLGAEFSQVHVAIDEFQNLTGEPVIADQMRTLTTQGRAAGVHVIAGTQKPLTKSFGHSDTPDQFSASLGMRVKTYKASELIMGGSSPRCDKLLPGGDLYVKVVNLGIVERVQAAYIAEDDLAQIERVPYAICEQWPTFDVAGFSSAKPTGRRTKVTTDKEWALALEASAIGKKRDWYKEQFNGDDDRPGSSRADRILARARSISGIMGKRGFYIVEE